MSHRRGFAKSKVVHFKKENNSDQIYTEVLLFFLAKPRGLLQKYLQKYLSVDFS